MRTLQVSVFAWDLGRESGLQGRVALQVVAQFGDPQHLWRKACHIVHPGSRRSFGQKAKEGPPRSLDGELLPFSHAFGASNDRRTNAVMPLRVTASSSSTRITPSFAYSLRNALTPDIWVLERNYLIYSDLCKVPSSNREQGLCLNR